ncbi:hypothetical protein PG985_006709 [Apiospora marii]|uniref:PNPLA domain-containing protein n=1 Tax=Apiospora marii TaxID=335849 RepID=A0ABR1S8F0_9PEZI
MPANSGAKQGHSSQQDFPVNPDMAKHMINFITQIPAAGHLRTFAAPVLASSILLDQYPPGMHLFKPADVFQKLYSNICLQVGKMAFRKGRPGGLLLPSVFSSSVLVNLESLFLELLNGQSAKEIHQAVLAKYAGAWKRIRSRQSCFTCFSAAQHTMECGHTICDNCLQVFGESEARDPLLFRLHTCKLCQQLVEIVVRVRPPTAGHGILCIDGGGIGGIIPTTILELVQDRLELPIPIQEHFSMAYGVSVGGLVILGLYEKGWSAATCSLKLQSLAEEAFHRPANLFAIAFFLFKWAQLLLFGHLYSGKGIENALKGVFGDKKIAAPSYATSIGTKIGILTASIDPPVTHLFTNYNGMGGPRSGYVVAADCDKVKTWEVARSTSAAPMYFPFYHLPGVGILQDGGVVRNNPTVISLAEFSKLTADATLDYVINLGTGSLSEQDIVAGRQGGRWRTSWLPRLVYAYLSLLGGQRTWNDVSCLVKRGPREGGYHRLDIKLEGSIALDDTTSMPLLRSLVLRDVGLRAVIEELAQRFFAALFYFELSAIPTKSRSLLHIQGRVMCTRKAGDPALPDIQRRLSTSFLSINGREERAEPTLDDHGNIQLVLDFTADRCIDMGLREDRANPLFPLSGAPYKVGGLVAKSGLSAAFGIRAHKRKADSVMGSQPRRRRLS